MPKTIALEYALSLTTPELKRLQITTYDRIKEVAEGGCLFGMDWVTMASSCPHLTACYRTFTDELARRETAY